MAGVALTLIALLLIWFFSTGGTSRDQAGKLLPTEDELQMRKLLGEGAYSEAQERIQKLSPLDRPRFENLAKQVALMSDLLTEPLPDFLRSARGLSDRGWQEAFRKRYRNQAILFDSEVSLDPQGKIRMDYEPTPIDGEVHLELNDVRLLAQLASREPKRFLFGLRLQDAKRLASGGWQITFVPDSGVLITDPLVIQASALALDGEIRDRIEKQAVLWQTLPKN